MTEEKFAEHFKEFFGRFGITCETGKRETYQAIGEFYLEKIKQADESLNEKLPSDLEKKTFFSIRKSEIEFFFKLEEEFLKVNVTFSDEEMVFFMWYFKEEQYSGKKFMLDGNDLKKNELFWREHYLSKLSDGLLIKRRQIKFKTSGNIYLDFKLKKESCKLSLKWYFVEDNIIVRRYKFL